MLEASMSTVARIMTVSTIVALFAAPALAQKVTDNVQRSQNLSELRTFTITETPRANVASQPWWAYERAIDRQITGAAVAAQLEARGFRRDDAHPDMYVTTHRTVQTKIWGYGWSVGEMTTGAIMGTVRTTSIRESPAPCSSTSRARTPANCC